MFGRRSKDAAPPADESANAANTNATPNTSTNASPPRGEQVKADAATSADGAAAVAAAVAPNSPTPAAPTAADKDLDERVETRVREILKGEREIEERTAAERAAHEAWIGRHAPRLAGTEMGKLLFAGANTDQERQKRVKTFIDYAQSIGWKAPDMGSSPEREGGSVPWAEENPRADRVAAAMKAAGEIGTRRL